jgi:hypothetical protein
MYHISEESVSAVVFKTGSKSGGREGDRSQVCERNGSPFV